MSMKFIMLINVKMPRSVGIFNIYEHDKYKIWEFESKIKFFSILVIMSSWNFILSWVEHENVL